MTLEEYLKDVEDEVLGFINNHWDFLTSPDVNVAGFERSRILWTAVPLVMDLVRRTTFHKVTNVKRLPKRPQGGSWIALGILVDKHRQTPAGFEPERYGYNGPICSYFGQGSYGQRVLFHAFSGSTHPDFEKDVLEDVKAKHNHIVLLCLRAAKEGLDAKELDQQDKSYAADAIKYKLLRRKGDDLTPNFIYLSKDKLDRLQVMCEELGTALTPVLSALLDRITANIRASAPESVWEQVDNFAGADFGCLTPMILSDLYKDGQLSEPQEADKHLLSFYIWG